jgi:hypothetical protein
VSDAHLDDEDDFDPEEAERQIAEFIAAADGLDGPPTAQSADAVLAIVDEAWDRIGAALGGLATNQIIATMLELSRRHRSVEPNTREQWCLSAASTLAGGHIPTPS